MLQTAVKSLDPCSASGSVAEEQLQVRGGMSFLWKRCCVY